jgi:hypothetical protein
MLPNLNEMQQQPDAKTVLNPRRIGPFYEVLKYLPYIKLTRA